MRIASGEDDDFAGLDRDGLLADDIPEAPPLSYDVIRDQVLGAGQDLRQDHVPRRRVGDPGLPADEVEEHRAREPHRFQHIG